MQAVFRVWDCPLLYDNAKPGLWEWVCNQLDIPRWAQILLKILAPLILVFGGGLIGIQIESSGIKGEISALPAQISESLVSKAKQQAMQGDIKQNSNPTCRTSIAGDIVG